MEENMRPALAIMVWIVLVGGLYTYMSSRAAIKAPEALEIRASKADYSLEITPTFTAKEDPFALKTQEKEVPVFRITLNGALLLELEKGVERGEPIIIENLTGMTQGVNEFHMEASPPSSGKPIAHALRFRLFKGLTPVLEKTVWSAPGERVTGVIRRKATEQEREASDHE
jgi:hypothetical protein